MNEGEIREMAIKGVFEDTRLNGKVEETHISWVILTRKYAFKIKKPLMPGFLDFSTLELRKTFCEKELSLNSRFSDIYLSVQPIRFEGDHWVIGGRSKSEVVDYCVVMKRMAVSKRMDHQLRTHKATKKAMRVLAAEIASFHNKAVKIFTPFDLEKARNTFNDITRVYDFAVEKIDFRFGKIIRQSIEWSDLFLEKYKARIQQRIDHGLKRDIHGDLHSGNIFLYNRPVLFDCLEFSDEYRQIDVLYEIAFLCMDLEAFHQKRLSQLFLSEYKKHFPAFQTGEDHNLFIYFKCLRANIRTKVHVMSAGQAENETALLYQTSEARKYLVLMNKYMASTQSFLVARGSQGAVNLDLR